MNTSIDKEHKIIIIMTTYNFKVNVTLRHCLRLTLSGYLL